MSIISNLLEDDFPHGFINIINAIACIVSIAVLAYFIFRDYKFMSKLDSTLDVITTFIQREEKRKDG